MLQQREKLVDGESGICDESAESAAAHLAMAWDGKSRWVSRLGHHHVASGLAQKNPAVALKRFAYFKAVENRKVAQTLDHNHGGFGPQPLRFQLSFFVLNGQPKLRGILEILKELFTGVALGMAPQERRHRATQVPIFVAVDHRFQCHQLILRQGASS